MTCNSFTFSKVHALLSLSLCSLANAPTEKFDDIEIFYYIITKMMDTWKRWNFNYTWQNQWHSPLSIDQKPLVLIQHK
jgi:hypothetical protein